MSHLRAPAARAERREGGRHGRPARAAPAPPETHLRPQLLRLAVLPPTAVALSACAAVLFTVRSAGARPGPGLWAVLAGAVSVAMAGILIAAVAADRAARSVGERAAALRRAGARHEAELRTVVEGLERGEQPSARTPRSRPAPDADEFDLLAADMSRAHDGAVTAVVRAARLPGRAVGERQVEVFVNLARRLQSLVHREISLLDELENEIEDPDLLKGLFHVDHLATRVRRHAENLAVLGGAVSRRQWSNPVPMTEVLRAAVAEVEQYARVKLVPPVEGTLRGHAVADVIHLLAELVENATVFSAPHTEVLLRVDPVTSGLAVEVEDRGLGMQPGELNRMNALLADPDRVDVASLLQDGRIGLYVVSQLARRHRIHVRLQSNIYGGVQAVLVVPEELAGAAAGGRDDAGGRQRPGGGHPRPAAPRSTQPLPGQAPAAAGPAVPTPRRTRPAPSPGEAAVPPSRTPGAGPAPLPTRTGRAARPNPADAVPGIRAEDRGAADGNAGMPPVPRSGAVQGTPARPHLPRRRAQEHLVPQLREAPAPRNDAEQTGGHDPGLMAAFRRGIGRAEADHARAAGGPEADTGTAGTGALPAGPGTLPGTADPLRAHPGPAAAHPDLPGPGPRHRADRPAGPAHRPPARAGDRPGDQGHPYPVPSHPADTGPGDGDHRAVTPRGRVHEAPSGPGPDPDGPIPPGRAPGDPARRTPAAALPFRPRPRPLPTEHTPPADGTTPLAGRGDDPRPPGPAAANGTVAAHPAEAHPAHPGAPHDGGDTAPGPGRTARPHGGAPGG